MHSTHLTQRKAFERFQQKKKKFFLFDLVHNKKQINKKKPAENI